MKTKLFSMMQILIAIVVAISCNKTNNPNPVTPSLPSITTSTKATVAGSSATIGGNVTSDGSSVVKEVGVCYGTNANPTINDTKKVVGYQYNAFTVNLSDLTLNTVYHFRAYAINAVGIAYGADVTFTTQNVAQVTTSAATAITTSSATIGGTVSSNGGADLTETGVCYGATANPTISSGTVVKSDKPSNTFSFNVTNLGAGKTYHARAYATNVSGTSYGADISFTIIGVPGITTTAATSGTATSVTIGGQITSTGAGLTDAGVCYGTSLNPTTADTKVPFSSMATGTYTTDLTGLTSLTLYHYRAYATDANGTTYGDDKTFFTFPTGYNMVSYFPLDGSAVNAATGNVGTVDNVTWASAGVNGKAFQGNGTNSLVTFTSVNGFEKALKFSVTLWIKSATPAPGVPFSFNKKNYSWEWTRLFLNIEGSSTTTNMDSKLCANDSWAEFLKSKEKGISNVFDGNWHQLAFTFDGNTLNAYMDGVLVQTLNPDYDMPLSDIDSFTIGGVSPSTLGQNGWMTNVNCQIDQVGLFSKALSASEIATLFSSKF